jgi:hypothetical protein
MKRRGYLGLVVLMMALSTLSCVCGPIDFGMARFGWPGTVRGSGRVAEEERPVSGITGVKLATFGDLTIEVGDEEELRIEAEENLIPYFETEMRDGTLVIRQRQNLRIVSRQPVNFYLTVKENELESIDISGSGDARAPDLEAERFTITITGSGDLRMEDMEAGRVRVRLTGSGDLRMRTLDADTLDVRLSGSGDMALDELTASTLDVDMTGSGGLDIEGGEVERQDVTITGSGSYRAGDLESVEADIALTGSGSATIQVEDYLNASTTGSGDVRYAGSPTVDKAASGSGDVERIGD